jgi:hypothetical protein
MSDWKEEMGISLEIEKFTAELQKMYSRAWDLAGKLHKDYNAYEFALAIEKAAGAGEQLTERLLNPHIGENT